MKKILIILLIIVSIVFVDNKVLAEKEIDINIPSSVTEKKTTQSNNTNNNGAKITVHDTTEKDYEGKSYDINVTGLKQCGAFGDPKDSNSFAGQLQQIFNIMKFLGIILALVLTIKDLVYAVAEQKNDTFPKIGKTALKRFVYAILIFFLPTVLNFIFSLLGLYGTCGII